MRRAAALGVALATACSDAPPPTTSTFPIVLDVAGRFPDVVIRDGRARVVRVVSHDGSDAIAFHDGAAERILALGVRLFVNWADRPHIATADGGSLLIAYNEKIGEGTYDYGVRVVTSNYGAEWSEPRWLHEHVGLGEHGFPSFAALALQRFGVAWLDGRSMAKRQEMALFARTIDADGSFGKEIEIDARVCDCCPTAAAPLEGFDWLVAYRDRGDDERRDIAIERVRGDGSHDRRWSSADGWIVRGCPVNGPALAVRGAQGVVAWYSEGRDGIPRVKTCAFDPRDLDFEPARVVAHGAVLGRVAIAIDGEGATWISWLENRDERAAWRLQRSAAGGVDGDARAFDVALVDPARASGHAALACERDAVLVAFTEGDRVRVVRVPLR